MSEQLALIETIKHEDKWSTFFRLLESTGAIDWLKRDGEFTVFAPTNDAFGKIPDDKMKELLDEPGQATLKIIISYHLISGLHPSIALASGQTRIALTGDELNFSDANGLKVNGARIQARNIKATNGIVHQIDTVLGPAERTAARTTGPLNPAKVLPFSSTQQKLEAITEDRPSARKAGGIG